MKYAEYTSRLLPVLKKSSWKAIWAGDWDILGCSDWGKFYTQKMKAGHRHFLSTVVFLYEKGRTSAWAPEADVRLFAKQLAKSFAADPARINQVCQNLKAKTDVALSIMKATYGQATPAAYDCYMQSILDYYQYHVQVKYSVEGLSPALLKKYLPMLQAARVYAEPVFSRVTPYERAFARALGKKIGYPSSYIHVLLKKELVTYFKNGELPSRSELYKRFRHSALVHRSGQEYIFLGSDAAKIERVLAPKVPYTVLRGAIAYPGEVTGTVRVVMGPKHSGFRQGDILVSDMTRPEYLPLMKKSGAMVTDAGGLLCHAAIVAREIKKPCIIGTGRATKFLKEGDRVRVDATKGIIERI